MRHLTAQGFAATARGRQVSIGQCVQDSYTRGRQVSIGIARTHLKHSSCLWAINASIARRLSLIAATRSVRMKSSRLVCINNKINCSRKVSAR